MDLDTGSRKQPSGRRRKSKKAVINNRRRKNRRLGRRGFLIRFLCIGAVSAGLAATLIYFLLFTGQTRTAPLDQVILPSVEDAGEKEPASEGKGGIGEDILSHIITAGNAVDKAYQERPESFELTEENRAEFTEIASCKIDGSSGRVVVSAEAEGIPISDDKYYYLFALNTYEETIPEGAAYLAKEYKDSSVQLSTSLNYNSSGSRLFQKFAVAVKKDGAYVQVSRPKYITNPEAIARYGSVYRQPASKKGLLVDPNKLRGNELDDLGVKQAAYNIPVARLLGPTSNPAWPTIHYTYNGRTYAINGQVVAEYDLVFGTLTAKGITTTAIILNNYSPSYPQLIHPRARSGSAAPYYMFNGAEESGVEYMAAIGTFLADRYSGNKHGCVSNWVIANEINARKEWNHMEKVDLETYVEEYAKGFRVFYNAIKSVSADARIYMPIDQQWDRNLKNNPNYDGKDVLDEFNRNISSKGNIDWGLSQHPYNVPLTEARIWKSTKYVKHNLNTSMITMDNIEVLTNYMTNEQFLTEEGEVRSIILSEQGYTSQAGEALQAAAFAYAYYKTEANPHIDAFLLNRQTDAPEEVAQGLSFGLNHVNGSPKQIYNVFKYIDTGSHGEYTNFAKDIIGISSWNEIMN